MWKSAKTRGIIGAVYGFAFPLYARNSRQEIAPVMTYPHLRLAKYFVNLLMAVLSLSLLASAAESKEKVLYSFQGGSDDGANPAGSVVFDKAGNLYGATTAGGGKCAGPGDCGTVFQLAPPAEKGGLSTETVLYILRATVLVMALRREAA